MEIDDRYVSATPEGVSLEFVLAGLGSRFTAAIIDLLVQGACATIIIVALFKSIGFSSSTRGYVTLGAIVLTGFLIFFGYFILFETLNAGRSPGKALTGLRVVQLHGGPVGVRGSVLRNVGRLVDWIPGLYGVGAVLILATRNNQRLGDLLAGTLVVRERSGASRLEAHTTWDAGQWRAGGPAAVPTGAGPTAGPWTAPPWLPPELVSWDATRIGASELAVVNRFLMGRGGYTPEARARLAAELAGRLWPLVAGPTGPMHPEHFLEAVSMVKAARG